MKPIDITPGAMETVRAILARYVPDREVRAFGSRVTWTAKEFSDLDLAVMGDTPLSASTLADISEAFSESELPFKVDVVDWAATKDNFRRIIEKEYVVIQKKGKKSRGMAGEGWNTMPFTEAVTVTPPISMVRGKVYPFVEMAAIQPETRSVSESEHREFKSGGSRFAPGDTLMARITPCLENGKIARFRPTDETNLGFGSTEFIVIRGKDGATTDDFAYYLTKWSEFRQFAIGQMTGSSGRQRVPVNSLVGFEVSIPPISIQERIAHILGTLDDKIELNRRMNETLEGMARAIFKSWFVDFDPVRAKAEGRDPGLPKPIADLFPDSFQDSELGQIPKGWKVKTLPEAIEVNPPLPLRKGNLAPYLDMGNMPTSSARALNVYSREFGSGMRFMNGDTLVARITPCLENGKTCFVDFLKEGQVGWGSTEYIVLRPKAPLPPEFAYFLARTDEFRSFAISNMTGTSGRQRVPAESLSQFKLTLPNEAVAKLFENIAHTAMARMKANDNESHSLAAIRDALLPKLLSGELRVNSNGISFIPKGV